MKKLILIGATALSFFMPATGLSASDLSPSDLQAAEDKMLTACLENDKNKPEDCTCVLGELKTQMKDEDYAVILKIVTYSMREEDEKIGEFLLEENSIFSLYRMAKRMQQATEKIDKACDGIDLNIKFDDDKKLVETI